MHDIIEAVKNETNLTSPHPLESRMHRQILGEMEGTGLPQRLSDVLKEGSFPPILLEVGGTMASAIKHYKGIRPRLTEEEDICQQSAQKDIETMMDIVSRLTIIKAEEEETKMLEMRKAMKKGHMRKEMEEGRKKGEEGRRKGGRRKGGRSKEGSKEGRKGVKREESSGYTMGWHLEQPPRHYGTMGMSCLTQSERAKEEHRWKEGTSNEGYKPRVVHVIHFGDQCYIYIFVIVRKKKKGLEEKEESVGQTKRQSHQWLL
ncbi:hypothetical protein ADUPG1_012061 [Aduncisulcus paluster]|uniref:Uncharacterized protein n=1 Tax=Aduncisulcus paluster TaxID=2918883 RepID=A0ABQ5JY62_9EUKA|nr:hypothetical protein ADUPG1_012061 [Aduncisulcus paluster]